MSFDTDDRLKKVDVSSRDADAELKATVSQFTLTFLKGVMMTGIYPPDHPAIADVASEPFLIMKRLAPDANEITFMSASAAAGDEIMVEGVLTEGIPFSTLMKTSMGDVFAKKFVAYFERNQLVSFSIKTRISREEFQKLISVFAERRVQEEESGRSITLSFSDLLLQKGVVHASAMARAEVVGGERPLPWRVKMAISRLRKDLRVVPLYSEATAQELAQAKTMLVQDITRPLRRPQFLKELLANTDLITFGLPELENVDMEREIIWCLHPGMLASISWDIVSDLERASWGAIHQRIGQLERRLDEIFKSILKSIALRLRETDPDRVSDLMNHLFQKKILSYKDLPQALQKQLLVEKWTEQFLASKDAALTRFASLEDVSVYREYLNTFQEILPELLQRKRLAECCRLVTVLREHAGGHCAAMPQRAALASAVLKRLTEPHVLGALTEHVGSPEKEQRRLALDCMSALGERAIGRLLGVLADSRIAQVRRDVAQAITKMGHDAHVPLMEMLSDKTQEWYVHRNVVMLLANVKCTAASDDIGEFLAHRHARVREEAIRALEILKGAECLDQLVAMLRDPEPSVARRAIATLGRLGARHPAFLQQLGVILTRPSAKGAETSGELVQAAAEAVARVGPFAVEDRDVRDLLAEWLEDGSKGLGKLLGRTKVALGENARVAVCAALGAIGDSASVRKLAAAKRDPSPAVRQRALDAVTEIEARLAKPSPARS